MTEGRLTKQLEDLINQLLELPEEAFTDSTVDVIIGMLRGSITEQVREEIIQAQLQEYRESNFNKKLARKNLDDFKADVAGIKTDFEAEWSKNKLKALSAILDIMVDLAEASYDRLENFDIELPFQLLHPDAQIPTYAHDTDAGADVYLIEDVVIPAFSIGKIIKTGLAIALPVGWEIQVRPRSGLSHKTAMRISNSPGTIKVA